LGPRKRPLPGRPPPLEVPTVDAARGMRDEQLRSELERIAVSEWRANAEDVVWRRTDLWLDEAQAQRAADLVSPAAVTKV
jgi:glycerol-3-phosphate dehydrogenase